MSTNLAVIEAALKAATPGPWWWRNTQDPMLLGGRTKLVMSFERMGMQGAQPLFRDAHNIMQPAGRANINEFADANLIANAPSWLAELVERVKAAEAAIERVRAVVDGFGQATFLFPDGQRKILRALDGDGSDEVTRFTSANSAAPAVAPTPPFCERCGGRSAEGV